MGYKFLDTSGKPFGRGFTTYIYIWKPGATGPPLASGVVDSETGVLLTFDEHSLPVEIKLSGSKKVDVLPSAVHLDSDMAQVQRSGRQSVDLDPVVTLATTFPEVSFRFMCLSSAAESFRKRQKEVSFVGMKKWVELLWQKMLDGREKRFEVHFNWKGVTNIPDPKGLFRRIDFHKDGSAPLVAKLVKLYPPRTETEIPVFLCHAAWSEAEEGTPARDGELRGYAWVKRGNPKFTSPRAIFLFTSAMTSRTLAHELSHWAGFIHTDVPLDNIGASGASGLDVSRRQIRNLYKWALVDHYRANVYN